MAVLVEAVNPMMAGSLWARVRDMIDIGYMAGDDLMPEDMLDRINSGRTLLWVAVDEDDGNILAAMTTELIPMRSGLVCWMCQCGGDRMQDWSRFHVKVEEYAKAERCVKVVLRGREGWKKMLPGYRVRTVQLEKVLTYD